MIVAGVATIPGRERALYEMVRSIGDQVDVLNIYCNGLARKPRLPEDVSAEVHIYLSHLYAGDLGDAGKFFHVPSDCRMYVALDDDLLYPHNYTRALRRGIDRHHAKVVSFHGSIFTPNPPKDYYASREVLRCLDVVGSDIPCMVAGTGVMGFCPGLIPFDVKAEEFKPTNMADIHMGLLCQRFMVGQVVLKHDAGWIRHSKHVDLSKTIYTIEKKKGNQIQTGLARSIGAWKVY